MRLLINMLYISVDLVIELLILTLVYTLDTIVIYCSVEFVAFGVFTDSALVDNLLTLHSILMGMLIPEGGQDLLEQNLQHKVYTLSQ